MAVPHSSEWAPGNTCWNCRGRNKISDSRQAAVATVGAVLDLWRMGRNMNSLRNMASLFHKVNLTFAVTACIPVLVEAALEAHLVRRSILRDLKQNLAMLRPSLDCSVHLATQLPASQKPQDHQKKTITRFLFFRFRPFEKDHLKKTISQWSADAAGVTTNQLQPESFGPFLWWSLSLRVVE